MSYLVVSQSKRELSVPAPSRGLHATGHALSFCLEPALREVDVLLLIEAPHPRLRLQCPLVVPCASADHNEVRLAHVWPWALLSLLSLLGCCVSCLLLSHPESHGAGDRFGCATLRVSALPLQCPRGVYHPPLLSNLVWRDARLSQTGFRSGDACRSTSLLSFSLIFTCV